MQICYISIAVHPHLSSSLDWFCRYILCIAKSAFEGNHTFINCLILSRLVALSKAVSYQISALDESCTICHNQYCFELIHKPYQIHADTGSAFDIFYMPIG